MYFLAEGRRAPWPWLLALAERHARRAVCFTHPCGVLARASVIIIIFYFFAIVGRVEMPVVQFHSIVCFRSIHE